MTRKERRSMVIFKVLRKKTSSRNTVTIGYAMLVRSPKKQSMVAWYLPGDTVVRMRKVMAATRSWCKHVSVHLAFFFYSREIKFHFVTPHICKPKMYIFQSCWVQITLHYGRRMEHNSSSCLRRVTEIETIREKTTSTWFNVWTSWAENKNFKTNLLAYEAKQLDVK